MKPQYENQAIWGPLTSTDNMFVGKKYTASGLFERKWTYLK